jgi:hypothetical protein
MYRIALLAVACVCFSALTRPALAQANSADNRGTAVDRTREILEAYWKDHDPSYVAEDAVFTMMPTGEEIRGRDAIARHLHHFYAEAFDATAQRTSAIFAENSGLLEALVVGRHTGEFAGMAATGRDIRVPLSVAYELENDKITRARIYLMVNVLVQQISTPSPEATSP